MIVRAVETGLGSARPDAAIRKRETNAVVINRATRSSFQSADSRMGPTWRRALSQSRTREIAGGSEMG